MVSGCGCNLGGSAQRRVATSLLFNIGKLAIGWYIGSQGLESTYGAAASIVVLLIWVYYSAQILLFGAEKFDFAYLGIGEPERKGPERDVD